MKGFDMSGLRAEASLSKSVVMAGRERRLFLVLSIMPDGSIVANVSRTLVLDLDASPSMDGLCSTGRKAIDETKSAAIEVIHALDDNDLISVYRFDSDFDHLVATTSLQMMRVQALREVNGITTKGGTRLGPALRAAVKSNGQPFRRVILLTDGDSNNASSDLIECLDAVTDADACPVWAFGLGPDYNAKFLQALIDAAKPGSFLRHVSDASEIQKEFMAQVAILHGTGAVTDAKLTFITENQVTIKNAARLVPDQKDVVVTGNGTRVDYNHGDLDNVYGQQLVLELSVPADQLGYGDFVIGSFLVDYKTPAGAQRETGDVWLTITGDESLAKPINDRVVNTALTVRGTRFATMGQIEQAQTVLTQAGQTAAAKQLGTIGSGNTNQSRAAQTMLTNLGKTIASGDNN